MRIAANEHKSMNKFCTFSAKAIIIIGSTSGSFDFGQ